MNSALKIPDLCHSELLMVLNRVNHLYQKHGKWIPIASFFAGFVFDMIMLRRIDDVKVILQQALYLLIASALIGVELIEEDRELSSPKILNRVWKYREALLHFLLGTLLNSYTIFYFKSASAITSFFFIVLLIALLTLNEFKRFGKSQTQVHVAFLSLCLISYLVSLAPTLLGFIGAVPFLCALASSIVLFSGYFKFIRRRLDGSPKLLKSHLLYPYAVIQIVFVILYFIHAIPPVPLSVKYMGIYHGVQKTEDGWELAYTRPVWKFWEHGDQTFLARPGDEIYCYAQIFSPTRFKDRLQVRWLYKDAKSGWLSSDAIPLPVVGGREEGYRAVTKKSNFQPGTWRVQVETLDDQEIGRIGFEVLPDDTTDQREQHQILR
jgi:hypothetical protein